MATTTAFTVLCGALLANGAFLKPTHPDERIVGGADGNIEDYPYQVSLHGTRYSLCGATIISERWVLTAAHCLYGASINSMFLRAGSSSLNSGGSVHFLARMIMHNKYEPRTNDYDFGLLEVETPFTFGPGVQPIGLTDTEPVAGEDSVVSGWGTTSSDGGRYSEHLQVVDVPIFDRAQCTENYADYQPVTERMICAGLEQGGKDTCIGDNGGPLVAGGNLLVGIVSWGADCAEPGFPSVYSNIANQRAWIKEKTGI